MSAAGRRRSRSSGRSTSRHTGAGTRALHFAGTTIGLLLAAAAVLRGEPFLLVWTLAASYGPAGVGHFFVERNRLAAFRNPLGSLLGDFRMDVLMWRGRMTSEIAGPSATSSTHPIPSAL